MAGAIRLETQGLPGVFLAAEGFEHDALNSAHDHGLPTVRIVKILGYIWGGPVEQKAPQAEASFPDIEKALTTPLTGAEQNPSQPVREVYPPVVISADTYEAAVEEFNQTFVENRWADGMALIPPTRAAVDWMLSGTSRSPDEVIGTVATKNGIATIEKIAINAVMAGAKPEYLPVIIAAMEGLADPMFNLVHVQASLGAFHVAVIVTGPIAKEIGMNGARGYLGYGWRANSSIGRAVRLCLTNLGQMWPAVNEMSTFGHPPVAYTFCEDAERSPWQPYHVLHRFKPEDSCVTVTVVRSWGHPSSSSGDPKKALDGVVTNVLGTRKRIFSSKMASYGVHPCVMNTYKFVVSPETAQGLNELGFDQEGIRTYVYENTRVPYEDLSKEELEGIEYQINSVEAECARLGTKPIEGFQIFKDSFKPGGKVPILPQREDVHPFVAGVGGYNALWSYEAVFFSSPPYAQSADNTKLIRGATLTKAGV